MPITSPTIHSSSDNIRTITNDTSSCHHHDLHSDKKFRRIADDHITPHRRFRRQTQQRSISRRTSSDTEASSVAATMQKPIQPIAKSSEEMIAPFGAKEQLHIQRSKSMSSDESSSSSDETERSSPTKFSKKRPKGKVKEVQLDASPTTKIPLMDVGPYDVLSGRDKAVFNHVGNRRFRVSLALWIPRYDEAQTKSEKAAVIGSLCHMLKIEAGVRFLKRCDGGPGGEDYYVELNSTQTKKKVGHAIRDMSVARKEVSERRSSARKAKRAAKLRTSISGQDYSSSSDDDASTSSQLTDSILSESLTALLPFVSNDPHDENMSMEPLPFNGVVQDSEITEAFIPQAVTSVEQSIHPSSLNPRNNCPERHFSASSSSILPLLPPSSYLLRSNSFPGPPPYYNANHFHYHYHQYHHPVQGDGMISGISSHSGEADRQIHQQQPLRPQQSLYNDSSLSKDISGFSKTMQCFESSYSSTQQQNQQNPSD